MCTRNLNFIQGYAFSLRTAIELKKVHCLSVSLLTESFYGIGIKKTDAVCKKMRKQKKEACCFLFVVKEDNEE